MSKTTKVLSFAAMAALLVLPILVGMTARAHAADDYLITASDTIPIFTSGAAAVKTNGLAVLGITIPYWAGALVAFAVIAVLFFVARLFWRHRGG